MNNVSIERINEYIDSDINTLLRGHNGEVQATYLEDGILGVKFFGECATCLSLTDTFDQIVREKIMANYPELSDVVIDDSVSQDLIDFAKSILNSK